MLRPIEFGRPVVRQIRPQTAAGTAPAAPDVRDKKSRLCSGIKNGVLIQYTVFHLVCLDKVNHWLCQWAKKAYSEGKRRQIKNSPIE